MNTYFQNTGGITYFQDDMTTTSKQEKSKKIDEVFIKFDDRYRTSTVKQMKYRYVIQPNKK